MSALASGLLLVGGILLLFVGAEALVRGSAALAIRLGLSPLIVGLTIVALATSSPELVVCIEAALKGNGDIAVGSVVGSNISNLALILGVAATIRPLSTRRHMVTTDMSVVVACTLLLVLLLVDRSLTRAEGGLLAAALVAYLLANVLRVKRGLPVAPAEGARLPRGERGAAWRDVVMLGGGLGILVLGADTLLTGALGTADVLGLDDSVIGLTIVAVGTSLPELATSAVAALNREGDIAVGNVIGSNVLNILGILGPSALISPLVSPDVKPSDLGTMVAITLIALVVMRTGYSLRRWEGIMLLACYVAYVSYLLT